VKTVPGFERDHTNKGFVYQKLDLNLDVLKNRMYPQFEIENALLNAFVYTIRGPSLNRPPDFYAPSKSAWGRDFSSNAQIPR
jgi:hypothetical protein